jgi:hypothetical protein
LPGWDLLDTPVAARDLNRSSGAPRTVLYNTPLFGFILFVNPLPVRKLTM